MNSTRALDLMHGGFGGAVVAGGAAVIVMVFVRGLGGAALSPIMMIVAIVGAAGIGGLVQRAMVSAGGTVAGQVVQAKVIDLYLGPLKDEGRALVEMRRLIERFPGTKEADEARAALARIKSERTKD